MLFRSRLGVGQPELRRAPYLGEHAAAMLKEWLGLDDGAVAKLTAEGAIERAPE